MFEQAAISVQDEKGYAQLHSLFDKAFDARDVEVLLNKVKRARLRIRDFAAVLERGLLGKEAPGLYKTLPVSDQALTRERYLRLVERVPEELRQRYLEGVRLLLRRTRFWSLGFARSVEADATNKGRIEVAWRRRNLTVRSRT